MNNPSNKVRVLLVDDEEEFLSSAARVLERRGLEVQTAGDGARALQMIEQRGFDVAVLDVKMPGIDGIQLFRRLQKEQPGLPVIILTGHGSIPQAFETSKEGVFDYLAKPFSMDHLALKIKEAALAHSAEGAERQLEETNSTTGAISVLVVDDEAELLTSLKPVLERRKMLVSTAQSGKEALSTLRKTSIDVVVLDVKMPGMDGLEVLRHTKQEFPTVEVILLTGHPQVESAMQGIKLGACEYLVKPPDVDELTDLIRKVFHRRQETLENQQKKTVQDILKKYPQ